MTRADDDLKTRHSWSGIPCINEGAASIYRGVSPSEFADRIVREALGHANRSVGKASGKGRAEHKTGKKRSRKNNKESDN